MEQIIKIRVVFKQCILLITFKLVINWRILTLAGMFVSSVPRNHPHLSNWNIFYTKSNLQFLFRFSVYNFLDFIFNLLRFPEWLWNFRTACEAKGALTTVWFDLISRATAYCNTRANETGLCCLKLILKGYEHPCKQWDSKPRTYIRRAAPYSFIRSSLGDKGWELRW